jgi:hypothetical protein
MSAVQAQGTKSAADRPTETWTRLRDALERAGAEFDALLDLTLYAAHGMALDAHLATEDDRLVRRDLVLGMARHLMQALPAPEGD